MEDLKITVAAVLKDLETRKTQAAANDPARYFDKVFAKKELRHIRPAYFRNGICAISVESSTWMYHLNLRKQDLLAKMRDFLPDIKDIRFVIGEIKVAKKK